MVYDIPVSLEGYEVYLITQLGILCAEKNANAQRNRFDTKQAKHKRSTQTWGIYRAKENDKLPSIDLIGCINTISWL